MLRLSAVAVLAMMALGSSPASAQTATFFTATYVEVGPVLARVGAATLQSYRDSARKDPGVVRLDVFQRIGQLNQFVVLGSWTDQKAYEAHTASEHAVKLNEKLATMLASPTDTRQHSGLSVGGVKADKDPVIAVTHVDVVPTQKDAGSSALEQLADESRRHAGSLRFDVWQQTNRPNHFTVVEAWDNRGAFDLHQMQKETRDFRAKLAPMSGALYDERLYKVLK